jgi:hypothetical protein
MTHCAALLVFISTIGHPVLAKNLCPASADDPVWKKGYCEMMNPAPSDPKLERLSAKAQDAVLSCTKAFYKKHALSREDIFSQKVIDDACTSCSAEIDRAAQAFYQSERVRRPLTASLETAQQTKKSACQVTGLQQTNEAVTSRDDSQREAEKTRVRAQAHSDLLRVPEVEPLLVEAQTCSDTLLVRYAERTSEPAIDVAEAAFEGCKQKWIAAEFAISKRAQLSTVEDSGVPCTQWEEGCSPHLYSGQLHSVYLPKAKAAVIAKRAEIGGIQKRD